MNVDHIDLIQCHDIECVKLDQIVNETLPALHKLKQTGKVRHVGITGLPLKIFPYVIDRSAPGMVETILSFCHYELNDTSLESLIPYFKQRNIGIINASPTGMGLLTERGTPAWHPASETIKAGVRRAVAFCKERGINIVELAIQFSIVESRTSPQHWSVPPVRKICSTTSAMPETPLDQEKLNAVLEVLKPIHNFNFTRGLEENRDPILG